MDLAVLKNNHSHRKVTVNNVTAYGYVCRIATTGRPMWTMAFQSQNLYVVMYGESPYPIGYGTLKRYGKFASDLHENGVIMQEWPTIMQDYENNQGRAKKQTISCYARWCIRRKRAKNFRYHGHYWQRKAYKGQSVSYWANKPLSEHAIKRWKQERGYLPADRF